MRNLLAALSMGKGKTKERGTRGNRRTRPGMLRMTADVHEQIRQSIGAFPAERGGVLGGSRKDGVVRHFHFDSTSSCTAGTYSPDHEALNRLFTDDWNPKGINLLGCVHSHPRSFARPSGPDLDYAKRILDGIPELGRLLLPIVQTIPDTGEFKLAPYAVVRDGDGCRAEQLELEVIGIKRAASRPPVRFDEAFSRVKDAYDLDRLRRCRIIVIGVGGAASFVEDLTRAGVGQFVLIDPDTVSAPNIGTQQVYTKDIGKPKVRVLARRIRAINPEVLVVARQARLDDIDDLAFARLALLPSKGRLPFETLLCGLTDNFKAQARVNRLALQFGLPCLCAQVYREGRGAEITFTHPQTTPACHRCALSARYEAYLGQGYENKVTSSGTPIFATTRLNALKGFIALALLHHGSAHPRFGGLLERIGNRNLVQIRMDPDITTTLGLDVFDRVFDKADAARVLFDDVVWLPQKPDCPETGHDPCPDCGGTGDLRHCKGKFEDTRVMPR